MSLPPSGLGTKSASRSSRQEAPWIDYYNIVSFGLRSRGSKVAPANDDKRAQSLSILKLIASFGRNSDG